jgi:cytochrome P450
MSGPRGWLPGGALLSLRRHPETFRELAGRYGDVVSFRVGRLPVLLISDPAVAHAIFTEHQASFVKGWGPQPGAILGGGLIAISDDLHRRHRKATAPAVAMRRLDVFGDLVLALAAESQSRWRDDAPLDIRREMKRLTLRFTRRALLGVEERWEELLAEVSEQVALQFLPWMMPGAGIARALDPRRRKLREVVRQFDAAVSAWIADRRARPQPGDDLVSVLLRSDLSDAEIRDEVLTMTVAGHETLTLALTWAWHLLAHDPTAAARLRAEIDSQIGEAPITPADRNRLPYTAAVLFESFRLYPPVWMLGRLARDPVEIGSVRISPGTLVLISPYILHRDGRWFPDPDRFAPERWMTGKASAAPRGAYLPFGDGIRRCIGEEIAKLEGVLVLASIARGWTVAPEGNSPWAVVPKLTLRPADGALVRVQRRRESAGAPSQLASAAATGSR